MLVGLLALLLVPVTAASLAGAWARGIVFDTQRYVATVAPLVEQPAIQEAMSEQISDQVVAAVQARLEDLPPLLAGPLEQVVDSLGARVEDQVATVVSSPQFADAWEEANRAAHAQVVASLTGTSGAVTLDDRTVSIRTQVFVDTARAGLAGAGFGTVAELLPDVSGSFVVLESDAVPLVRTSLRVLDTVGGWLWAVAVGLAAAVVVAAPRRLAGVGLAASAATLGAALLAAGLGLVRAWYVASTPVLSDQAKQVLFDQVTAVLRTSAGVVVASGLVVVAAVAVALVVGRRDVGPPRPDLSP